jgi:hypothetical protein
VSLQSKKIKIVHASYTLISLQNDRVKKNNYTFYLDKIRISFKYHRIISTYNVYHSQRTVVFIRSLIYSEFFMRPIADMNYFEEKNQHYWPISYHPINPILLYAKTRFNILVRILSACCLVLFISNSIHPVLNMFQLSINWC